MANGTVEAPITGMQEAFYKFFPPRLISIANLQDAMQAWNTSLPYTPERSSIIFNSSVGTTFRRTVQFLTLHYLQYALRFPGDTSGSSNHRRSNSHDRDLISNIDKLIATEAQVGHRPTRISKGTLNYANHNNKASTIVKDWIQVFPIGYFHGIFHVYVKNVSDDALWWVTVMVIKGYNAYNDQIFHLQFTPQLQTTKKKKKKKKT